LVGTLLLNSDWERNLNEWVQRQSDRLAGNGNPRRSVEELAAHVLSCKPLEVYFKEPTSKQYAELDTLMTRAEQGEPIQYIIGHVDFRGVEIHCDPRALIPRPETELLVEEVLMHLERCCRRGFQPRFVEPCGSQKQTRLEASSTLSIVDVCTGTGCVGLALAAELPLAEVVAIDISLDAIALARENAERLGLMDRFSVVQGDLLHVDAMSSSRSEPKEKRGGDTASTYFADHTVDVVVSNPPYILSDVCLELAPCVRDFEPQLALDGGADGMDLIRPLVEQSARVLKPGGGLFVEMGYDQGEPVSRCMKAAGFENVRVIQDLAGLDRIVRGELRLN
jgi:release factor glutamine methyltransferase